MGAQEAVQMGEDGTVKIPIDLRQGFGMDAGMTVILERTAEGILIRPAVVLPVEAYTPARKAEFLLNNAVDLEDYRRAVREVRGLGIEPDDVPHTKPVRY
jgi:bifunctional DNA-binding transcriptional regulator/antitoxin component of YhaV-PrlF toxin-antitoxin module